ncbi:hypothetical protein P3S67_010631 [Capsicum chacoense]
MLPNPDYLPWMIVDTQIRACLLAVISPSVHKHARGFLTSASLWDALATRYNSVSTAHIFQLRDRLHTLRKGTKTMTQYLDDVASILSDLDTVNEIIPERDVVNAVLRGLPSGYSSLKQHIRLSPVEITLNQLSGWLNAEELNLDMEHKLLLGEASSTPGVTALYSAGSGGSARGRGDDRRNQRRGSGGGDRRNAGQQGRGGPPSRDGFQSGRGQGRGNQRGLTRDLPTCQICAKRGHSAANYWYRYDDSQNVNHQSGGSRAMHASTNAQSGDWYLDTGANTHVTSDYSHLQAPHPYHGSETITVGNGQSLPIRNTGSGYVYTPNGPKPAELYGKYTWKIDKFSQINKRELRSNAFEVGGYKWYILIYPQECDVCNHLSLFLCVVNHDKLLPGWSHFAQFTIALINKDPKKSKYSDTLHRFWKKEHDWGWKKIMELSKVVDGFIDADTLTIKAQVQAERAERPFQCLDCQYRRELVRVYLTNVEQIFRRFVEE